MADFGLLQGLAVSNQADQRIDDYRYHDQVMKQNQALAEARAKIFADSVQYQNAANSFDNARIKARNDAKIREIGKFYKENPDALYNPDKLVVLNEMRRSLLDNEDSIRGRASDDAFRQMDAYLAEAAKNPNMHNQQAIAKMKQQKANYLQYGNAEGIEGAEKAGLQPFVFERPADFIDLSKKGQELGNKFQDIKVQQLKNGRSGAWETVANDRSLDRDAQAFYLEHKEQFDQQHGANAMKVAKELIKSGVPYKFDWGDNHFAEQVALMRMQTQADLAKLKAKNAGKDGGGFDYYKETIQNKKIGADTPERLDATFGSKPKHYIKNDNGSVQLDNTGSVFNYNGDFQDIGSGIKRLSGYVYKPLKWGEEQGVLIDPVGPSDLEGSDYSEIRSEKRTYNGKVEGGWAQTASIVDVPYGDKGETKKMLKIKVYTDIDGNSPAYQGKYNSLVATTDQRNAVMPTSTVKSWNGIPVGTIGMYEGQKVQITESGPVPVQ